MLTRKYLSDFLLSFYYKLLRNLEDVQIDKSVRNNTNSTDKFKISDYLCLDPILNLIKGMLYAEEIEKKSLDKSLRFCSYQKDGLNKTCK